MISCHGDFCFAIHSVMYRKYKEQKDNEYETIIRRQVNESKLVAEQEGISIPKTLDDYVAPSRAGALGNKNDKKPSYYSSFSNDDDDLGIDVSYKRQSTFHDNIRCFRMMMIKWLMRVETMMKDHIMIAIETNQATVIFN